MTKFKVLIGARRTGATTKMLNLIKEDVKNKKTIGIVSSSMFFREEIARKIDSSNWTKHIINESSLQGIMFDKIYIFNLSELSDQFLNLIKQYSLSAEIYCDKVNLEKPLKIIEFEIAKEVVKEYDNRLGVLIKASKFDVDMKQIIKYTASHLTRPDVELERYKERYDVWSILQMKKQMGDTKRYFKIRQ